MKYSLVTSYASSTNRSYDCGIAGRQKEIDHVERKNGRTIDSKSNKKAAGGFEDRTNWDAVWIGIEEWS